MTSSDRNAKDNLFRDCLFGYKMVRNVIKSGVGYDDLIVFGEIFLPGVQIHVISLSINE